MAVKIELKRSAVPGKIPTTSSLELGELAVNTYDGKVYLKQDVTGTQSIVELASTSGSVLSASYALYASNAGSAVSSSYALNATTSSYALVATSASYASNSTSASYALNATSASYAEDATSASYAQNSTSSSYALVATSASYALNSTSASYAEDATSASYALEATSASYAQTSSYAGNFTVAGTLTAQKLVVQTISSSVIYSSGSNVFGDEFSDTQTFTGSVNITGSLTINGKNYLTDSASFDTRILNNSSSINLLSGSYLNSSASFDTRILNNSSSIDILSGSYLVSSASFDTRILENSSSINLLSSSFVEFSGSYNTGSFTGSFTGSLFGTSSYALDALSSSYAATASNIMGGVATHIPFFKTDTTLATSSMYQSGSDSIIINQDSNTSANPEALYVWQPSTSSFNVISGKGNLNNYLQLNIQNTNQGVSASSDVVATANNGNEESMYINMGINNENFSGPLGESNDAYLYSIANNLHIGSAATGSQHLGLFVGGLDVDENNKITLRSNNLHEVTGSLNISGSIIVLNGITGSLFGTASFSTTASYAQNANLLDGYDSAAFLLTSSYNSFTASYLIASASFSSSISSLSSSYLASSASFNTRITNNSSSINLLSGSYLNSSASFNTRITNNSSSINLLSGSYLVSSASFDTRILNNSSSIDTLSGSYLNSSASFDSRILNNSSSISTLSSSFLSFSGSYTTGSFTGSFAGDGGGLTNISASSVVGLNLSQISSGSVTASVDPNYGFKVNADTTISGSTLISGSLVVTGSTTLVGDLNVTNGITGSLFGTSSYALQALTASYAENATTSSYALNSTSASYALNATSASYAQTSSYASDFTVTGTLTAQKLVVQTISSSVIYSSGSNVFGDDFSDTQTFTGSVNITGSLNINGSDYINTSASFDTRILNNSSSIEALSSSFLNTSSSFDTRILNNSSSIDILSSSYLDSSASFDTRILNNSSSIDILSGSYLASSASFDTRILENSSSINLLSGSYLNDSSSFNSRIEIISSSYATTGSNVFKGDQTITGSLTITGSTTQIGNNTLFGNNILSGSITISSSHDVPSSPSFNIDGNVGIDGIVRFVPIQSDINPLISGSYIYSSGSTNDLYFTQNADGYANTTRLRWLEGNLYTGLLHGGLISAATGSTTFNVSSGSGIIVNTNASLNTDPFPTIQLIEWGNFTAQPLTYLTSSIQTYIGINSGGTITEQTTAFNNGQYNTLITLGTVLHQNKANINASITYPNVAYGYKQRTYDFIKAFGPLKLSGLDIITTGSLSLNVASGTAFSDGRNYQVDPNNPSYITDAGTTVSKIFRYYQSGSEFIQDTNSGVGYTAIDPTKYNNNGTLTTISDTGPTTEWSIQRVFWYPNSATKGIVVYYGNALYSDQTIAIANLSYEPFVEVENTKQNAVYLGAIAIQGNGSFATGSSYIVLPGGVFRNIGGSGGGGAVTSLLLSQLGDVTISGPTNKQPLAYDTTLSKWTNTSFLSASISGNSFASVSSSYALSASYALSSSYARSSSYALNSTNAINANYATTAGNGGVTQITAGSGVTLIPSNGLGNVTVIAAGTTTVISGSNVTQSFSNQSTWTFNHNLGVRTPIIEVFDSTYNQIIPENLELTNNNTATITFPTTESGFAVASLGGVSLNSLSSSYSLFAEYAYTASNYAETDPIFVAKSGSLATTGSNTFIGDQTVSGSLTIALGNNLNIDSNIIYASSSTLYTNANIVPTQHNTQSLGTTTERWKDIWLGGGSLYLADSVIPGSDLVIEAINNILVVSGSAGLEVGSFKFVDNELFLKNEAIPIIIGSGSSTAPVIFNRPIDIVSGETGKKTFEATREGRVAIISPTIPANDIGALSIIGNPDGDYQPIINPSGMVHVTGNNGQAARVTVDGFGSNIGAIFVGRQARGTAAAPTTTISGDILARYAGLGYSTSSYFPIVGGVPTALEFQATENYSTSGAGSRAVFYTYANGAVTRSLSATIDAYGIQTSGSVIASSFTGSLFGTASFAVTASHALNVQTINTGSFATTGSNVFIGNQTITGSLTLDSGSALNLNDGLFVNGNKQFQYASFYHTASQTAISSTTTAYPFQFSTIENNSGAFSVALSGSLRTRITTSVSGWFNVQYSAQARNVSTINDHTSYVWLRVTGSNVVESNNIRTLPQDSFNLLASKNSLIYLASGSYFEVIYAGSSTNVTFPYTAAGTGPTRPSTPSISLVITQHA